MSHIRLYRYIFKEIGPQFITVLIILSTIIVVSQLVRLSEALVAFGITLENIFLPFLYIIVPFMSFNIPIAYLGAVMIGFSRFSADGEYAAMLAGGLSLRRMAMPVIILGVILYFAAAICSLYGEPWGRKELDKFYLRKAQTEVDSLLKYRLQAGVFTEDFLGYVMYAERISEDRSRFENVMLAPGPKSRDKFMILAPSGTVQGSVAEGKLSLNLENGVMHSSDKEQNEQRVLKFDHVQFDLLKLFRDQILGSDAIDDDYRGYYPAELFKFVQKVEKDEAVPRHVYWKSRYQFHQRFATPFIIVIFACFGMVLGVTDPRSGRNRAYIGAIAGVIFGYVVVMAFKWFAEKGQIAAPLAAWLPNILLLGLGTWLVGQKDRLPPSESPLDPANIREWVWLKKKWAQLRMPVD